MFCVIGKNCVVKNGKCIKSSESLHVNLYPEYGSFTTSHFPDPTCLLILIISAIVAVTQQWLYSIKVSFTSYIEFIYYLFICTLFIVDNH